MYCINNIILIFEKLKQLTKRNWSVSLDERIIKSNQVIRGWINYFKIADMKSVLDDITSHLNRRIRCIIWKQWKNWRHRFKCLVKLGINKSKAIMLAMSRKSYWNCSHNPIIDVAISNERLRQKGLALPLDHYLKVHTVI